MPAALLCRLLVAALLGVAAEAPPADPTPPDKKPEPYKLPADAVIVVADQAADALRMMPKFILLAPEKYQALLDEIDRLKALAKPRPAPPARCRLKGKVEGGVAALQAQFDFHADRPDAVVALACGQAKAVAAQLSDGRTPLLSGDADGFLVQVDKAGDYTLTLDLAVPLTSKNGGRGLELDLPRAVVTSLELDLPADARTPRLGARDLAETSLTFKNGKVEGPLGPTDKLDLSWQGGPAGGPPQTAARGRIQVRVEDGQMTTEAELVLRSQGGATAQWVLLTPVGAEVKAAPADQARVQSIAKSDEPLAWRYTVALKEPSDKDLTVLVGVRAALPAGGRAPVGPFAVRGAARQSGVVLVTDAAPDVGLQFHFPPPGELPREPADPGVTAAFAYAAVPALNKPLLEIEAQSLRGSVKTVTSHVLTLGPAGADGRREWTGRTTVQASPLLSASVSRLEIKLPPECQFVGAPAPPAGGPAASVDWNEKTRVVRFQLPEKPAGPFAAQVDWKYAPPAPPADEGRATVPLPRPVETRDGGGQVEARVPDDVQLLASEGGAESVKNVHRQTWAADRAPEQAALAWRPYRPEAAAAATADVTLNARGATVKYTLVVQFPPGAPRKITLAPPASATEWKVTKGADLLRGDVAAPADRPDEPDANGERVLAAEYKVPLGPAPEGAAFVVPLPAPGQVAAQGETKVRVWCGLGRLPRLARPDGDLLALAAGGGARAAPRPAPAWAVRNLELVRDADRLPALVLAHPRLDAPLWLRLADPDEAPPPAVEVKAALYRVVVDPAGAVEMRASFRLARLAARDPEVELPGPAAALEFRAVLDGKAVAYEPAGEGGRVARLRLDPDLIRTEAILYISYKTPGRGGDLFLTALTPPRLRGDSGRAPARWRVSLPADWAPLGPEGGPDDRWTLGQRRGALPAPQLDLTNDQLEELFGSPPWLLEQDGLGKGEPSVVFWRDAGESATVVHAPQLVWLLACSLSLLTVGLALWVLARRGWRGRVGSAAAFWLALAVLAVAAAAAAVFTPAVWWNAAYGAIPGAVVLGLTLLVLWGMHAHYRRQIVFLPNFRRSRSGSSLVRGGGSSQRPHGEPSTVDAPRPGGSSDK
jgi:hypothetical protein